MSILKVDNIRDNGTGFNDVVSFQNGNGTENGKLVGAFVNFNGVGAISIRGSFNVNSLTDNGNGDYTANFANSFSSANYAAAMTGKQEVGDYPYSPPSDIESTATGSVRMRRHVHTIGGFDTSECHILCVR